MKAVFLIIIMLVVLGALWCIRCENRVRRFQQNLQVDKIVRVTYMDDDYFEVKEINRETGIVKVVNIFTSAPFHVSIKNILPL